jgi:hypothetical protein
VPDGDAVPDAVQRANRAAAAAVRVSGWLLAVSC